MAKISTPKVKKKPEIFLNSDGLLVIDGKEYNQCSRDELEDIDGIKHFDKTAFKEFNREEFEEKVEFITSRIKQNLRKDDLIKELIKKNTFSAINKLYNVLKDEKKEIKVQRGCIGIKIGTGKSKTGGAYLQLIE